MTELCPSAGGAVAFKLDRDWRTSQEKVAGAEFIWCLWIFALRTACVIAFDFNYRALEFAKFSCSRGLDACLCIIIEMECSGSLGRWAGFLQFLVFHRFTEKLLVHCAASLSGQGVCMRDL